MWLLTTGLVALALILHLVVGRHVEGPLSDDFRVAPWVLVAMFFLAEVFLVHVVFRREAYSLSLSEMPVVLGLFFATGPELVAAQVVGVGAAMAFYRRQPVVKLSFNVAHMAANTGVALAVFHGLGPGRDPVTVRAFLVTMAATMAAVIVASSSISIVISLYERRRPTRKLLGTVAANFMAGATNTSLALTAVVLVRFDSGSGWFMAVPAGVLLLAYRSLVVSRRKQETLQFLYAASRILHRGASREGPMVELLELARQMFHAEVAELTLLPAADGESGLRTTAGPGDAVSRLQPVDRSTDRSPEERGLPMPAMVSHLEGEHGRVGTMLLAGPAAVGRRVFSRRDLELFETLANHVGVALENGMLGHQAFHDDLTGLGNRALFVAELERLTGTCDGTGVAVLFVDLDDLKTVNDTLGHAAGDELLVRTAERLLGCLRPHDVAARLGGDEFAVLLAGSDVGDAAARIAERVLAALGEPVTIAGRSLRPGASIGVAVGSAGACSVDELLREADVAMYTAKMRGKRRWEFAQVRL